MTIDELLEETTAIPETGCLIWLGAANRRGYGFITVEHKRRRVDRLAWLLSDHKFTKGRPVCHRCHTKLCINPGHLFLGSTKDKVRDVL